MDFIAAVDWIAERTAMGRASRAMREVREKGCDAESPSVYLDDVGGYVCRCITCARCKHHTGNSTQGHYWARCRVTGTTREFHFCCPGNCELETGKHAG